MKGKGKNRRIKYISIMSVLIGGMLTGCEKKISEEEYIPIVREEYEKKVYQSVQVETGSINPELSLKLKPDEYEVISYSIKKEMLEVEEINIEKGSRVNAGDVMVVFKNDGIREEITTYQNRNEENALLLTHYENLQVIDPDTDYSEDIKSIKTDITVTDAYIKEAEAKLADYQLVAEKTGVVTRVADELFSGYANMKTVLIQVASGSSNYVTVTSDDYSFELGAEYEAASGVARYTMKLIAIDDVGNGRQLTFEPISDMSGVSENSEINILIRKPTIENALYVDEKAVTWIEDEAYLYILDEQGYRHAVKVTVEDVIDGYAILTDGVEAGEWVTLQ